MFYMQQRHSHTSIVCIVYCLFVYIWNTGTHILLLIFANNVYFLKTTNNFSSYTAAPAAY